MLKALIHIAFLVLTGRRRVLGIVWTDESISIAVVTITFPIQLFFRPQIVIAETISLPMAGDINDPKFLEELKAAHAKMHFHTAFVCLRSSGVRVTEATVPRASSDDIGRWVTDNHEKLHRLPVALNDLAFASDVIGEETAGVKIRVAFVRREHLEQMKNILSQAGILVAGLEADEPEGPRVNPGPLGSDSEHAAADPFLNAQSVAARGLLGKSGQPGLLTPFELDRAESQVFKALFQRTVLACGALLLALLATPFMFSYYVESRQADVEEKLLSIGPAYTEVRALETQIAELEAQLSGPDPLSGRLRMAAILRSVASASSDGLWFTRLTLARPKDESASVHIEGYARDGNAITQFMKRLESRGLSKDVKLIRSGSADHETRFVQVKLPSASFAEFELTAIIND